MVMKQTSTHVSSHPFHCLIMVRAPRFVKGLAECRVRDVSVLVIGNYANEDIEPALRRPILPAEMANLQVFCVADLQSEGRT